MKRLFSFLAKQQVLLISFCLSFFIILITTTDGFCQTKTWTGSTDAQWKTDTNWNPNGVPTTLDDVTIQNVTKKPLIKSAAVCKSLTISNSATLTIGASGSLTLSGSFTNNGSFDPDTYKVTFTGSANASISGTSNTAFHSLIINKGSGTSSILDVNGTGTISISDDLTLTSGLIRINTGASLSYSGRLVLLAASGLSINGGTYTQTGGGIANDGSFTISSGSASIGTSAGNCITNSTGSSFALNGGTVSVAGRLVNSGGTVNISGGSLTLTTIGNSTGTASFEMSSSTTLSITGNPTIIFQNANSESGGDILIVKSSKLKTISGGTFQFGNSSTLANSIFHISSGIPLTNLTVNSHNSPTVQLTSDLILTGDLDIRDGVFDVSTYKITPGTSITNNGTVKFGGASNGFVIPMGTIEYNGATPQTVAAGTYQNLTTSGTGLKTIATETAVTVNGNLNVANGSALTIASTAANATGSLIVKGFASGTGAVNVERYLPTNDWHLISSPVSGQTLTSFGSANNIEQNGIPLTYDLGPYNEATDLWDYPVLTSGGTDEFDMAKGYSTERLLVDIDNPQPGVVTFTGTGIYTGNFTGAQGISITHSTNGWNCIGNPYTSAIKATESTTGFIDVNVSQLDETENYNTVYLWDNETYQYQPITSFTGLNHIAVGQGFIVKAKTGGGSVTFNTAMQEHQNGAIFKDAEIPWPAVTLKAEAGDFRCTTLINFNETMTTGLDPTYDAGMFKGNPNIALYSRLASGDNTVDFSVQSLPPSQTGSYRIPVGLDLPDGGEVSFTAETMNLSTGDKVILEDVQTQLFTDLGAQGAKYTTVVAAKASGTGRFYLHTGKNSVTAVNSLAKQDFTVITRDRIITINGEAGESTGFSIYNIEGKQFANLRALKMNQNTIDATGFPSGIYLLRINNMGRQQVAKLVLMN